MHTRTHRAAPIAFTLLAGLVAALATLLLTGGPAAEAHDHMGQMTSAPVSQNELALRQDMRSLWEEHVMWTRLAIISLTTDAPDTKATVVRLLRNQADIGNAIKPFYGPAAGNELTALLRQHILIAADLIAAARKGDAAAVKAEQARWHANANVIAGFLAKANPGSWKLAEMKTMMQRHLRLTTDEVVARLQKHWAKDVRAYDGVETEILQMADMLSDGLVAQFPARFR
jgi:hypothetical protein